MQKRNVIFRLCTAIVILLSVLDLMLNHASYTVLKNAIDVVILILSATFLLVILLRKNKSRYLFLILAYVITFGVYLPFLFPNSYALFKNLFTFWQMGMCVALLVIAGLVYHKKQVLFLGGINLLLMGYSVYVLQRADPNQLEFNWLSVLLFALFTVVFYLLCHNWWFQLDENNNNIQTLDTKKTEIKLLYNQAIILDKCQKLNAQNHDEVLSFIEDKKNTPNYELAKELKNIIIAHQKEIKLHLADVVVKIELLPLINLLRTKYPEIIKSEAEVAVLTYYGYSNKTISQMTNLAPDTVSRYRISLKEKMGLHTVEELKKELDAIFGEKINHEHNYKD